ncbi:MAG: response regulator transcription factor [Ktedonobacteraceae bacterium]
MTSAFLPSSQALSRGTAPPIAGGSAPAIEPVVRIEKRAGIETGRPEPVQTRIRVLIADDHEVVRKGVCALLGEEEDFEVVGQTGNGQAAVMLAIQLQPDIVLLDIPLESANGLDIAQQLLRGCPEARIIVFTGSTDDASLLRAMHIGVHGYLQKTAPLADLLKALRAVQRGERVIGEPRALTQVLNEFSKLTKEQSRVRAGLSDLEIELVRLAAAGCSNKEIAARQFWSEVTVKRKMQDIYRKLQVTDRAQAVAEAMRMGLI